MVLKPCSEASRFSYILFSKLASLGSWSSLGLLGLQIMVLEPCSEASRFSYILLSKPAISGCWSSLGLLGLQILVLEPCFEASRLGWADPRLLVGSVVRVPLVVGRVWVVGSVG